MTMNIGGGYPMMMGGMGMGMGMNTGGNVPQYFQAKYGCEDCFEKNLTGRNTRNLSAPNLKEL